MSQRRVQKIQRGNGQKNGNGNGRDGTIRTMTGGRTIIRTGNGTATGLGILGNLGTGVTVTATDSSLKIGTGRIGAALQSHGRCRRDGQSRQGGRPLGIAWGVWSFVRAVGTAAHGIAIHEVIRADVGAEAVEVESEKDDGHEALLLRCVNGILFFGWMTRDDYGREHSLYSLLTGSCTERLKS